MARLLTTVLFTKNAGDPATGLALVDIEMYLSSVRKSDDAVAAIWTGENPTAEIGGGLYFRPYAAAEHEQYDYFAWAEHVGATVLDSDHSLMASPSLEFPPFGSGAVEWTYQVTEQGTGDPIEGAEVWITTDVAGDHVIWSGASDALGWARDVFDQHPLLDAGVYHFWVQHAGHVFDNPDTETVS